MPPGRFYFFLPPGRCLQRINLAELIFSGLFGPQMNPTMDKQELDLYTHAHLAVAAIRVIEHQNASPASIEDLCKILSFSLEQGHYICRRLAEMEIIGMVEGAYGIKLYIKDHLKLEEIPKGVVESKIEKELQKFQTARKQISKKIETIKSEQAKKKQDLFAEIEQKLKKGLKKNKPH